MIIRTEGTTMEVDGEYTFFELQQTVKGTIGFDVRHRNGHVEVYFPSCSIKRKTAKRLIMWHRWLRPPFNYVVVTPKY